jgi:hypothetical protein
VGAINEGEHLEEILGQVLIVRCNDPGVVRLVTHPFSLN